jgi:hypothetical protein
MPKKGMSYQRDIVFRQLLAVDRLIRVNAFIDVFGLVALPEMLAPRRSQAVTTSSSFTRLRSALVLVP